VQIPAIATIFIVLEKTAHETATAGYTISLNSCYCISFSHKILRHLIDFLRSFCSLSPW